MSCTGTVCLLNIENVRKKEMDSRKKLRLVQVRQQSKDFANMIRKRVEAETKNQRQKLLELQRKQIQEQRLEKLNQLREAYQACLQNNGESHREAAKQPNFNELKEAESVRLAAEAAARGVKARTLHLEQAIQHRQKIEAPIKQKRATRNKENFRSWYVSSLPNTQGPEKKIRSKKTTNPSSKLQKDTQVLQDIPSNLASNPNIFPYLNTQSQVNKRKLLNEGYQKSIGNNTNSWNEPIQLSQNENVTVETPPKECSCGYVCGCHGTSKELRRRCFSESRVSSECGLEFEKLAASKVKLRSRSCSPQSVRTLNYHKVGNLYEGNQPNFAIVTHHSREPSTKEQNTSLAAVEESPAVKENNLDQAKLNTEKRSSKALQREQLKRDFQQLLNDLRNLSREKIAIKKRTKLKAGIYQKERDILVKRETKQRKLVDAFETLLNSTKPNHSQHPGVLDQDQQALREEFSPPTLNLALYKQRNMSSRGSSPVQPLQQVFVEEEITISQTSIPGKREHGQSPNILSSPARSPPRSTRSPTPLSGEGGGHSEMLSIRTQSNGDVHLTVRVDDKVKHKKKCKRYQQCPATDSSSSYFSPPENLSPSQKRLLDGLLEQINKRKLNKQLRGYIQQLLTMSRESIDNLETSYPSMQVDPTRSPPQREIEDDIEKLSDLTELYADKVNTLVDMFEQFEQLDSSEQHLAPPQSVHPRLPRGARAPPPSRIPTPVRLQPAPSPAPVASRRIPRRGTTPTRPSLATPIQTQQPRLRPRSRTPSPAQRRVPLGPTTPPMHRRTNLSNTPMPQVRVVGPPPGSEHTRIPIPPRYQSPQRAPTPQAPVQTVPGTSGIQTPFGLSSNLLPHPTDVFGQTCVAPPAQVQPGPSPRLSPINESPEKLLIPSPPVSPESSDGSADWRWAFEGLPIPEGTSWQNRSSWEKEASSINSSWSIVDQLERRGMLDDFQHIFKGRKSSKRPESSPQEEGFVQEFEGFGNNFEPQDDFANEFGDEDFAGGADVILQTEAPDDDVVDYPEDFPPPSNICEPEFDWSTANLSNPNWPHSFLGDRLGGSEISNQDQIKIDATFDEDAVSYPLNVEKLNKIRRKLSNICNDQYRQVIEMLQQDYDSDKKAMGNLLKRVASDPFEDPDATLAPIRSPRPQSPTRTPHRAPQTSYGSPTQTSHGSPTQTSYGSPNRGIGLPAHDERISNMDAMILLARSLE